MLLRLLLFFCFITVRSILAIPRWPVDRLGQQIIVWQHEQRTKSSGNEVTHSGGDTMEPLYVVNGLAISMGYCGTILIQNRRIENLRNKLNEGVYIIYSVADDIDRQNGISN